jgi:hypothetical protein
MKISKLYALHFPRRVFLKIPFQKPFLAFLTQMFNGAEPFEQFL